MAEIIDLATRRPCQCKHQTFKVGTTAIYCADCGTELDAVSCVRVLAGHLHRQSRQIQDLHRDLRSAAIAAADAAHKILRERSK